MKKLLLIFGFVSIMVQCGDKNNTKLFNALPATQTGVHFINQLTETEDWNILQYLYFYNGGGVAIGDINNDGLPDLAFTANQLPNKIYVNHNDFGFEDVTKKANFIGNSGERAWKTGISMADVNADGWLDIYVCQVGKYKKISGKNELFINQQDGTFKEMAAEFGLDFQGFSQQAAWLDYDQDGDVDMYLLNHSVHSPESFVMAEKRNKRDRMAGDVLFRNDDGKFVDVSEEAGIYGGAMGFGLGISVSDLDENGYPDIYISNDFHENDYLYLNNGDSTFLEKIKETMGYTSTFSMGCDMADVNNDGRLDVLTVDMRPATEEILKKSAGIDGHNLYFSKLDFGYHYQYPRNMLHLNRGVKDSLPFFSEVAPMMRANLENETADLTSTDWSWSPLIADFDNDGFEDIFITNGIWKRPNDLDYLKFASAQETRRSASNLQIIEQMPSGEVGNFAFKNMALKHPGNMHKSMNLSDKSIEWGLDKMGCSNGAAYADLDNDGDLDLVVNNLNEVATIYENTGVKSGNYLKVRVKGSEKNPFGIGAKITILEGEVSWIKKELYPVRGWQSSMDYTQHFGTTDDGPFNILITLEGKELLMKNVKSNATITADFKDFTIPNKEKKQPKNESTFKNITTESGLNFTHQENKFIDFNIEPLLPKQLSMEGPALAIGDVNNDGLEDVFIGGAKAQASVLFLQKAGKKFVKSDSLLFENDKMHEAVDATFFDADNDGDLDLYVVSGGGESREGSKLLEDLLCFNNGKGRFFKKENTLPNIALNGSCVVAADFNEDGNVDLFVGSHSIPVSYGLSPESVVLLNDGKGNFTKDETFAKNHGKLGMVTDAVFSEKEKQLVVVGEWMSPIFLEVEKGVFEKITPKIISENGTEISLTGMWNCIGVFGFDSRGNAEYMLGNMGLNSIFGNAIPLELYVKDFDDNHQTEPIITYHQNGKKQVFTTRDNLTNQLSYFRKQFLTYQAFAEASFAEIFPEKSLENVVYKKAEYLKSIELSQSDDGSYIIDELDFDLQSFPVQDFTVGTGGMLAVGNFYGNHPSIGKMDAGYGYSSQNRYVGNNGFFIKGDARRIVILEKQKMVIVALNNGQIQVFGY